jgi:hypothetical protein
VRPTQANFRIARASKIRELPGVTINNTIPVTASRIFQVFESCNNAVDLIGDIVSYD